MKKTVRLSFEFPRDEYPYLEMLCAQRGISCEEFAAELLLRAIEEYEDEQLAKIANKRLEEMKGSNTIPWGKQLSPKDESFLRNNLCNLCLSTEG